MPYVIGFLAGLTAGSRVFTALAATSWAANLGRLDLAGSWLAFMGYAWTPWIFTLLADRRNGHRPTSLDAEPKGPDAVRRTDREWRALGRDAGRVRPARGSRAS